MPTSPRVWLITGASSGFGRAITELVLQVEEGDIAVATLRNPSDLDDLPPNPDRLLVVKCDVTKPADILSAFACAVERFGRVDIVFNNAGCSIVGEIEATPEEAARALFDVNFWGAAAVSKEAIRMFRDVNPPEVGGRLLSISSGLGFGGRPILGIYSASKHALEGFTEALRLEMNPAWNIKISIIAPGAFKTRAHTTGSIIFPAPEVYSGDGLPSKAVREWFKDGSGIHGDPILAAKAILKFSKLDSPPVRWAMGRDSIGGARAKIEHVTEETKDFESRSENLEIVV
ncbi:NAD(P)-binding protein [Mycena sp. CBHHK59/15]|nr:NAD(P)-binding protein [Mycena sp. CBHHK59/15]KAJ6587382.1 NAD(P)-binding protein [Mycena sp. CBHHK59/15]